MESKAQNGRRTIEYRFLRQLTYHEIPKIRYISAIFLTIFQFAFFLFYGFFVTYSDNNDDITKTYPRFVDIHTMVFIGFGFLMTFLKRYGYGSVGYNFLLAAYSIEWAILIRGWFSPLATDKGFFTIGMSNMLSADFCVIAVLISFGAVIGKASLSQLVIMATIEVILQSLNEYIGVKFLRGYDVGKSIYVHLFGAYFGLAVSRILQRDVEDISKDNSHYNSDLLAMIGTLFLWVYWPSYNSAAAIDEGQTRAIVNTYLALVSSCVTTYIFSLLVGKGRLNMIHIQNATLAGGVAVGAVADMMIQPYGAMLIGSVAGALSTLGFHYITTNLNRGILHDTCGIHNLHAIPGLISGIASAIVAALATEASYGGANNLHKFYPSRLPSSQDLSQLNPSTSRNDTQNTTPESTTTMALSAQNFTMSGLGRSALTQGGYQLATVAVTIAIALIGGALTGLMMRLPIIEQIEEPDDMFDDETFWVTPEDFSLKLTEVSVRNQNTTEDEDGTPIKISHV